MYVCGNKYVGEAMRNATARIDDHEQANGKSSKHLKKIQDVNLKWTILEAYFIKRLNLSHNDQLDSEKLILFRNGVF